MIRCWLKLTISCVLSPFWTWYCCMCWITQNLSMVSAITSCSSSWIPCYCLNMKVDNIFHCTKKEPLCISTRSFFDLKKQTCTCGSHGTYACGLSAKFIHTIFISKLKLRGWSKKTISYYLIVRPFYFQHSNSSPS